MSSDLSTNLPETSKTPTEQALSTAGGKDLFIDFLASIVIFFFVFFFFFTKRRKTCDDDDGFVKHAWCEEDHLAGTCWRLRFEMCMWHRYTHAHTTHYLNHIVTQNIHTKRTLPTTVKPPHSESMYRVENMTSPLLSVFLSLLSSPPPSPSYSTSSNPHRFKNNNNNTDINPVVSNSIPSAFPPTTKTLRTQSQTTTRLNFPLPKNPKAAKGNPSLITLCPNPALY